MFLTHRFCLQSRKNVIFQESAVDCPGITIESSGVEGGIAEGDEANSILFSESTRATFINELLEVS